jgi:hypothetical protein
MLNPDYEMIEIHQEGIRHEAYFRKALRQCGKFHQPIVARGFSMLGDTLIRMGTKLKEHAYSRVPAEEASVPTYLIML